MLNYFDFKSQRGSSEGGGGGGAFLGLLAIAGILIFGVWYLNSGYSIFNRKPTPQTPKQEAAALKSGQQFTVEMTNQGFIPTVLVVHPYDTVTFINKDAAAHWPASDPHPTHTNCPGFDALRPLFSTEKYAIVFQQPRVCSFHDHLQPKFRGTITIE